jgi:hypothetical protein
MSLGQSPNDKKDYQLGKLTSLPRFASNFAVVLECQLEVLLVSTERLHPGSKDGVGDISCKVIPIFFLFRLIP